MTKRAALTLALLLTACPAKTPAPPTGWPTDGSLPSHPRSLPFDYERPDVGEPVSPADLATVTDHLLDLLTKTRYLRFIDDRAHGWPETDPGGHYWYGTWWSGVSVHKAGGQVTYTHSPDGADNNGLRTASVLEGACYAYALWKTPEEQHLTRKLIRGFNSWFRAMQRSESDTLPLLSRAAYPASVDSAENGRNLHINYDADRPGQDASPSEYIHVTGNPSWPDLWTKNKRSKDDLGHMLRAVAQLDNCADLFTDSAAKDELKELRRHFVAWSAKVESDNWAIATLDKNLEVYIPTDDLAHFATLGGFECTGQLAVRLEGHGEVGDLDCADGNLIPENSPLSNSAMQIIRTFQEASAVEAILAGKADTAQALLGGLATRVQDLIDQSETTQGVKSVTDVAALLIHSANAGVPLTSREVRWLHARIEEAHTSYTDAAQLPNYDLFSSSTPDGDYSFDANGSGLDFKDLGALLGTCVAQYRNPKGRPVLDCDRVRAWSGL